MYEAVDVIELLIWEHKVLCDILEQLDAEDRPAETEAVFYRLVTALAAHEAAEEDIVFPAFQAALGPDQYEISGLLDEHEEIDLLVTEMRQMSPASFGFLKRASALCVELQEHLAEEEEMLFPLLRSVLDPRQLLELAERVQEAGHRVPAPI